MPNTIEVYKGNTKTIICTVTGLSNLNGYTATLTVKKAANNTAEIFNTNGSINALVITFVISTTDNDQTAGQYVYEITIADGGVVYTLRQDKYTILEAVTVPTVYLVTVTVTDGIPTYYGEWIFIPELDKYVDCSDVGVATFLAPDGTYNCIGSNDTENLTGRATDIVVSGAPVPGATITIA